MRDSDAARAEQRAGKKYQETKESRQIAEDASVRSALEEKFAEKRWEAEENDRIADGMSTQAAIDEKLAARKRLESQNDPLYNYDREAASDYALKYAMTPNPEYVDYSKILTWLEYALRKGVNAGLGDCANFVSQSMNAGGIGESDRWHGQTSPNEIASVWEQAMAGGPTFKEPSGALTIWPNNHEYTSTWTTASNLFQFCSDPNNNCSDGTLYFSGSKEEVGKKMREAGGLIRPGDLLFWDADQDGTYTHATIISGFDSNGTPQFAGHSSPRDGEAVDGDDPWKGLSQQNLAVVRMRDLFNMNGG